MSKVYFSLLIVCILSSAVFAQTEEKELLQSGKLLFQINCARCHGMQGKGGTGPNLARSYLPRASTDEQLANVISNGIPGSGMPAVWILIEPEVIKIIAYVRFLGTGNEEIIIGDAENGKKLFSNSICSTCHIVSGEGGSLGPDLTKIGLSRGQNYLLESISHPGKAKPTGPDGFYQYLNVRVTLNDGEIIEGLRVNEDSFSMQIKDAGNVLHSYEKGDIASMEKIMDQSLMPSFTDQLSQNDMTDIAAYLTTLK